MNYVKKDITESTERTLKPDMDRMELRARRQAMQRKKQQQGQIRMLVAAILITAAVVFLIIHFCSTASARELDSGRVKYYTSIQIHTGDSLWSIAEEYISEEYHSVPEYIEELKRVNHLKNDTIHSGKYLVVSYYR